MSEAEKLNVDQLVGTQHFERIDKGLKEQLGRIQSMIQAVNIYRPLRAWKELRSASVEAQSLRPQVDAWLAASKKAVGEMDVTTMAKVVTAPTIMLSIHIRTLSIQHAFNDISSELNTLKAFAFGVLALYVSVVSMLLTVGLGVLPFLIQS